MNELKQLAALGLVLPSPGAYSGAMAHDKHFRQLFVLLFLFILHLLVGSALAADKVLDASQIDKEPVSLTEYLSVLEDPGTTLTLADVQAPDIAARFKGAPASAGSMNYGYTLSAYWLRLTLRNTADHPVERILEIANARLSEIDFHQTDQDGLTRSIMTGYRKPFEARAYGNRFFVFPVNLPAHSEKVFHLRLQAPSLQIPVKLWAPEAFHEHEVRDYLGQAWYFGMATAMILFNLLLFVSLRDILYWLYVVFVSVTALASAADGGLANQFLWPDSPRWAELSVPVLTSFSVITFLPFTRRMLNTARVMPSVDGVLKLLMLVWVVLVIGLGVSYQTFIKPYALLIVSTMAAIIVTGLMGAYRRQRSAFFFLAAFSSLALVGGLSALRVFGLVTFSVPPANLHQAGSALEMMVLAFALADRYNQMRREKEMAQREKIQTQAQLNVSLERLVEERTDELVEKNKLLEQLSVTDRLTGLYNRLKLDQVIEEELSRNRRSSSNFALVLLDADLFKSVNDSYGHLVGDQVLAEIAKLLVEGVREVDIVGRWGGEEFLIVCRDTDMSGAAMVAEKLRQKIAANMFPMIGQKTCSFGVTCVKNGDTMVQMVARVDRALYQAKENGRNRVECQDREMT